MKEAYIKNWNKRVKPNETIYVLGDFSFMGNNATAELLTRLNGHKILIWGNHDRKPHKMLELGFDEVYETHDIYLNDGNQRYRLILSHFPFAPIESYSRTGDEVDITYSQKDLRYLHKRVIDDGKSILLHGHTHSTEKVNGRMIHVGVDAWDGAPVSHEQILELVKKIRG